MKFIFLFLKSFEYSLNFPKAKFKLTSKALKSAKAPGILSLFPWAMGQVNAVDFVPCLHGHKVMYHDLANAVRYSVEK